jgi:hypothetical protein
MGNKNYPTDPSKNPYRIDQKPVEAPIQNRSPRTPLDFEIHRICPACGKIIKINHNFCKFCGTDISSITPIGHSDDITKKLANAAIFDQSYDVRKEAIKSLVEFHENNILGILAYVLLNDPDESVRKEAAEELGKIHHPYSLDVLASALKDRSPIVRKEAIEGLKKIKTMNKPPEIPIKPEKRDGPVKNDDQEEKKDFDDEVQEEPPKDEEIKVDEHKYDEEDYYKL